MKRPEIIWIVVIVAILAIISFSSCKVQKHIVSETHSVDSSVLKSYYDSVRMLKTENSHLQWEKNQLQYAGVQFDTVFVSGKNDTIINTVTITKEGDVHASGKILSAYVSKTFMQKVISDKDTKIDSLAKALQNEKSNVKTVVQTKEVDKVVKAGFPWALVLVTFVVACYVRKYGISKVPFLNEII